MKQFGSAIILAGGQSSRMGFDKQFLEIENRRLIISQARMLSTRFDDIIVVTNKPEQYLGLGLRITTDQLSSQGPLSGIHAGLLRAQSRYALVMACDMPLVNLEYIEYLQSLCAGDGITTRFQDWVEPFCSFYSKDIVESIAQYLGEGRRSIKNLMDRLDFAYVEEQVARTFSPRWEMFHNLNTKEDLAEYLRTIGREQA